MVQFLKKFLQHLESDSGMFHGFEINRSDRSRDSTASKFSKDGTIDRLVDCLNGRFDKQQSSVLKATKLADFLVWPKHSNYAGITIFMYNSLE